MSTIAFMNDEEKGDFLRRLRLFSEDVTELSGVLAIPIALSRRSDDPELFAALNKNASFWNAMLAGLQTSSHVIVGRIHDKARETYLSQMRRFLQTRKEGAEALGALDALENTHDALIGQMVKLRQKVFAHADFNRPLHEAFRFNNITAEGLEAYCHGLSGVVTLIEQSVFSGNYGPKHNAKALEQDIDRANKTFDSLCGTCRCLIFAYARRMIGRIGAALSQWARLLRPVRH